MSSTPGSEAVFGWLRNHPQAGFALRLYVYGSFVRDSETAADVDVLVVYPDGQSSAAARSRRVLEHKFKSEFGVPLHAIFLSDRECSEEAEFVALLLEASTCLR